jgi:hypothetical protein
MSLALFITRIVAGVISSTFVSLRASLTPTGGWLFFVPFAAGAFVFVAIAVPETMGVALEDMPKLFDGSARRGNGADGALVAVVQSLPVLPTVQPPAAALPAAALTALDGGRNGGAPRLSWPWVSSFNLRRPPFTSGLPSTFTRES